MKGNFFIVLVVVAVLAAAGGWFAARHQHAAAGKVDAGTGKIYSCSMHPQVRSNKPGKCPICGMELAPIGSIQSSGTNQGTIMLSSNVINVINVQTESVQRRKLTRTLRMAGVIDDDATRHRFVSAYIDGRIDKLFINYTGAEVVQGQPLATFYSPTLLSAQQEYALLVSAQTNTALRVENERLIAVAEQRLRRLGLSDAQIKESTRASGTNIHTQILASMSGTAVQRLAYEGQYVKEGEKLFEIADFSTMWFQFDAYERDLPWLKPGQMVDISTPSVPGNVYRAPISFIDPNLNEMTRSAKARVELQNPLMTVDGKPRRELLHKTYGEAVVKVEIPDVLAVPRSAVLSPGRKPVVYVEKEQGFYEQRPVKLGRAGDDYWEVLEGANEGERVVTSGNMLIDAQAQLNQSGAGAPVSGPEFTEHQQKAVSEVVAAESNLAAALASDNVERFNELTGSVTPAVEHFAAAFADSAEWKEAVAKISAAAKLQPAKDLKDARRKFQPFADAVAQLARSVRRQPAFANIKVFRCPMTDQAFPGAPKSSMWVQTNAPLRNPFFGSEMIDCGNEVK
ncbi:MAG TPA: efflux RND transporter periplasmic adaptor subunit [Candidatus Binatia bacterium]|nr:efflux RND transporter periplasmic adaptor subunit [Candidatus Binatia bacterium]